MNLEEELSDRVTSCRCLTVVTIRTGSGVGLSEEGVTVAFVDIYRNTYVVRLTHGQQEGHDTVASFRRTEGLLVRTALSITYAVEQEVRALTDRMTYRVGQNRDNAYVTNQRAVVAIYRLEVGNVVTGLVDIVLQYGDTVSGVPGVRRCVVADGHGVVEHIRRMDT